MGAYCRAVWQCRYFWLSLVRLDLRSRYRGSVLGMGWSLLQPLAMTAIICVVFSKLFGMSIADMAAYVLIGLACWNYILTSTLSGCQCFFQGESYIRQYPAPMAIYPLRTVLGAAFHFGLALLVAYALGAWNRPSCVNLPAMASLLPTLLLLLVAGWAVAVLGGLATVFFRDTRHLIEVAFQVVFYMTPIIYRPELLGQRHLDWLLRFNPIVPFLNLLRLPIEQGQVPSLWMYSKALLFVVLTTSAACYALSRLEKRLIFHL
jgi:ABC-type polysaccharide/polyol phosphate export permease